MGAKKQKRKSSVGLRDTATGGTTDTGGTRAAAKTGKRGTAKKAAAKTKTATTTDEATAMVGNIDLLTSQQEIADYLQIHPKTFEGYLREAETMGCPLMGKHNGRWRVPKVYVFEWFNHYSEQKRRHVESRRRQPAEPPELQEIKGR